MQDNKSLLDILSNNKFFKQIASEVKNSKGTPAEIMTRIANDYNIELPKNVAIEIHTASDDVLHFIIPADLSSNIDGMEETIVAAGSQQATVSSIGSVSCFSTLYCASSATSVYSLSTVGSVASAGTASSVAPANLGPVNRNSTSS